MFEFVTNLFGGATPQTPAAQPHVQAPAPQIAPVVDPAHPAVVPPAPGEHPGDHPPPTATKPVDQKAMDAAANTIFKKMDGWWVSGGDKGAILDTLRGKSPEEIAAIKRSYGEHFPGHDMDSDLGKNLNGKDLTEAKASLSGDPVAANVAAIKNAETGAFFGGVDNDKVKAVLEGIADPKVRAQVAKQVGAEVTSLQDGNDKALTMALLDGDTAKAGAVKLDEAMHGGLFGGGGFLGTGLGQDKDAMYKAIEGCADAKERAAMVEAYKTKTNGADLTKDLHANLDGASKDVADKLLVGDKSAANAARVQAATEGWFTDKDSIYKTMEGKSEGERKQMLADYQSMYKRDMNTTLGENLSGLDLQKAKQLEDKGKLDDAFALKYAMEGSFWTTDKTLIKQTLEGKDAGQIDALSRDYQKKYGINLQGELGQTTSGRDGFEIKELLKGEPKTVEDKMDRARNRYDFERGSGSNAFSKAFVDTFSDKGQLLDQQQGRMEDLYKKIQSGQATSEEQALLERVTGYQSLDTKNYQETKDSVANGAAAVAAITASTVATLVTGGAAAPAEVAIIAAMCGGGATIATKLAIQDQGYSKEELRNDLIMTGVNAATGGAMGALGAEGGALFNAAAKISDNPAIQQAFIQGVSGMASSGIGNATQTMLGGGGAKEMLSSGGMGMLTGGAGGMVTGGVGAGLKGNKMFEGMDPVRAAMMRNAIAGGTGALVSTGIDPASYQGDSGALLLKWGTAVGGGALQGLAGGYNEGTMEVKHASELAAAERQAAVTGEKPVTAGERAVLDEAKALASNPAEAKVIEQVRAELAAGNSPALPVEEAIPSLKGKVDEPIKLAEPAAAKPEVIEAITKTSEPITEPTAAAKEAARPSVIEDAVDAVNTKKAEELVKPAAPHADAGDRQALIELSRGAKPEDLPQIAQWSAEIDAANPKPMLESLRELNIEARADGKLTPTEGSALKEWGHEGNLDRMPLLDAMHYEGLDKGEVARVFDKAVNNDAGASYKPGDAGVHTASDGTPLAVPGSGAPGALTPAETKLLIDVQARRFDELHGDYTTSSGREVEASPMRKAVNETQAAEYAAGERLDRSGALVPTDKIGGDVGLKATTDGHHAERAAATLGLDYDHHSNQYFDPATNTWTPMVSQNGLPVLDFPLTPQMHEQLQVPLGTDATEMFKQQGRALAGSGEYVPELLRGTTAADGTEQFPHLQTRDRQSQVDPRVGWGFSATERAIDPATGLPHPVVPNQEHNVPHTPVPDYEVGTIAPKAKLTPEATVAVASAPEAAKPIAEHPALGAKVEAMPEIAPVVAAVPELAKEMATPGSAVGKLVEQVAEGTPKLAQTTELNPQEAFNRASTAKETKTLDPTLSHDIPGFLAAAEQARVGADPVLQAQRAQFETAVAMSPEAHAAVKGTLDTMCAKALDYITQMRGGESFEQTLASLGKDPSSRNYAGAVGTDPATIKAVFEGGNVRERMVVLAEFQEKILGPDTLKPGGIEEMMAKLGGKREGGAFDATDIARLEARRAEYLAANGTDKPSVKGLLGPLGDASHADYAAAKAENMDTKLPSFTAEAASEQLGRPVSAPTPIGEASPFAQSQMTVEQAQAAGMDLSSRELARVGPDGKLPWVVGSVANMVDPSKPFIQNAAESSMPLKAGISGTTFRAMELFEMLGADPSMGRLAAMSQLTSIDAHSFHEIANAAQGFFPENSPARYDQSTPYTSGSMGLDQETLARIAQSRGLSLDDLNNQRK